MRLTIIIVLTFFFFNCNDNKKYFTGFIKEKSTSKRKLIQPGKEFDGLKINKSNIEDAINKYGKNEDFSQGIVCGNISYHTNRFKFQEHNIVIISTTIEGSTEDSDLIDSKISNIGILSPNNAITSEGIHIMIHNYNRIIDVYGEPESIESWNSNTYIHYYSRGISFDCNNNDSSIRKIEIYQKDEIPDFYYWMKDNNDIQN